MSLPIGMICRPWITIHGERIYAKDYGKKAFCFFPTRAKEESKLLAKLREFKKTAPVKQQSS